MHFTPTFLPVLIHALVSVARAVPLHANAGLGDLAIRAPPTQNIRCAVTNQQGGTSIAHDEARTTKMVQWVLEGKDVMTTVLGQTKPLEITYPNPYPYDIKKPQPDLRGIYKSIAEVSGVRLSYFQIVASFSGSSIKGTPRLTVAVNQVAKSSVRWLFEQPEMIAKFGSLVIAFLNDFPLESIPPHESVHFQFHGARGSPCPEEKPCFALVGINQNQDGKLGHANPVHYGAVWDYDYGLVADQARQPIVVVQVTVPRAQEIALAHASEHGGPH
ncbi:hypothetical protein BT96DRAFT_923644 [Gymnopus androsaceus JB14]|uniref:Uncharacterized protein n=1 Tax=Gymnopus androsaceus JB14 TaxID=1447944 RepID=A0A6A4H8X5_9AGAR|nr:hypothetical protein BT96DRAFT_923644 [Gymnopus androsaceus JB14]